MMKTYFPLTRNNILIFAALWLMIAFPLGLYTLLVGPSKWLAAAALHHHWSEALANGTQKGIILLWIIVSFVIAALTTKLFLTKKGIYRPVLFSLLLCLFGGSVYLFAFHPEIYVKWSGSTMINESQKTTGRMGNEMEFTIGSYPDADKIALLKSEGYTAIITLMSELVVPAEPKLLHEEKENTEKAGISLIHIPMLPWVSSNSKAQEQIRELLKTGHGKYYVHCYLGRDRVNIFRKMITDNAPRIKLQATTSLRKIEHIRQLERGRYYKINNNVYITPLPTNEEFLGYIVNGNFKTVVSILDEKIPENKPWIEKEKKILKTYNVGYVNLPYSHLNDTKALNRILDSLRHLPEPILIHEFRSDSPCIQQLKDKLAKK
jgi:protein tyrosine phosphatase (PTP) superfamily phosphohydrolase (DUF442 family)